jgi:hypothetical protein
VLRCTYIASNITDFNNELILKGSVFGA